MARTVALITERLPVPGLAAMVIGYVWDPPQSNSFAAACEHGYYEMCEELHHSGWAADTGMRYACRGGHMEIILLMIKHGANMWNWGLREACYGNQMDAALLMIERGAHDWNLGLKFACYGGHMNMVRFMLECGADELDSAVIAAGSQGHLGVAVALKQYGALHGLPC